MLTCDIGYYHSTDVQNSYVSFYFSKPILIHSYFVYSVPDQSNCLYNWELQFYNSNINQWILIDNQTEFDTLGNNEIITLETSIKTNMIKIIGGKDKEGDRYFLKFYKIEFYGHIIQQFNSQQNNLFILPLFYTYLFIII